MASTVAYLSAGYPRVTDAFITREIDGVSACGLRVERFAIRRPADAAIAGDEQRRERELTTYILGRRPLDYLRAVVAAASASPKRFASAVRLAAATRRVGLDGAMRQVAYLVEAAVLSAELRARGVAHLHNHFSDSSCTVAMLASELSGVPFSFTIHGPAIFFEPREWALETKLERALFTVAISQFARSQAAIYGDPRRWDRLHVVHCGVVVPTTVPPAHDRSGIDLLFVGRLEPVKGVLVLLEALAQATSDGHDIRLTVVGDGAMRPHLEKRVADLGLGPNVRFEGFRSSAEVADYLAACDAVVLPSFAEGVPVSLMEAMSMGRCVVATTVGGVAELVEDGVDGLLVGPGDVEALSGAITRLADGRDDCDSMGSAGHAKVARDFDSATEARRLVALFRDAEGLRGTVRPEPVAP